MKLGSWLIMITGMIIFLTILGIDSGLVYILEQLGLTSGGDLMSSNFYTTMFAALAVIGSGAVVVGLFAKSYDTSLVILPFILFILGLFTKTFFSIINLVGTYDQLWMTSIVLVIFGSLGVGFIMSCVDYFVGR